MLLEKLFQSNSDEFRTFEAALVVFGPFVLVSVDVLCDIVGLPKALVGFLVISQILVGDSHVETRPRHHRVRFTVTHPT